MFVLQERGAEEEHTLNFTVPITEPLPPQQLGEEKPWLSVAGESGATGGELMVGCVVRCGRKEVVVGG